MKHQYFEICLRKEDFKFSSAHMSVFPDGSKEALHGHNYQVGLRVRFKMDGFSQMISFSEIKGIARKICGAWDEKVLIARHCPFLQMHPSPSGGPGQSVEFSLCGKRYLLPADEVLMLPTDNLITERLAEVFSHAFVEQVSKQPYFPQLTQIDTEIQETPGQSAVFRWSAS